MPGGQERILRRRIRTIESTKKITRAFELIAASQIVRAQSRIAGSRPYVEGIESVLASSAAEAQGSSRFIGDPQQASRVLLLVIVADRGLCGGYNSMALRRADRVMQTGSAEQKTYQLVTVGKKAPPYFRFRHRAVDQSFIGMTDRPTFDDARRVAKAILTPFLAEEIDVVELVSWRFRSAGTQVIEHRRVLPLPEREAPHIEDTATALSHEEAPHGFYDFEPEPNELLELVVPTYAEAIVYQALLEASASEHTARQRAMAAATENAEEFITTLRREMDRVRQEAITTEIMEIIGGAEALRNADTSVYVDIDAHYNEEQIA